MSRVHLALLGGWAITGVPADRVPVSGRRLLTYLALRGRSTRRELAGTIWPDASEEHAMGSLRTTLWRLRGIDRDLVTGADDLRLGAHVTVDLDGLRSALARVAAGTIPATVPDGLLHGDLAPAMGDDWLLLDRERLRQRRLHALEALAATFTADGRPDLALVAALAAVRAAPLRESARRVLVGVYLALGRVTDARRQADDFRARLHADLGIEPSDRLRGLVG